MGEFEGCLSIAQVFSFSAIEDVLDCCVFVLEFCCEGQLDLVDGVNLERLRSFLITQTGCPRIQYVFVCWILRGTVCKHCDLVDDGLERFRSLDPFTPGDSRCAFRSSQFAQSRSAHAALVERARLHGVRSFHRRAVSSSPFVGRVSPSTTLTKVAASATTRAALASRPATTTPSRRSTLRSTSSRRPRSRGRSRTRCTTGTPRSTSSCWCRATPPSRS